MPKESFPEPWQNIDDVKKVELEELRRTVSQLEEEKAGMANLLDKVGKTADTEHIRSERLKKETTEDTLTGFLNRRVDDKELEHILSEVGPEKKDRREMHDVLTVVMLDIDNFKNINDTYGHAAGDAVIKEAASYLKKTMRGDDNIMQRRGGEEFLLLLSGADQEGVVNKLNGKTFPVEIIGKDGEPEIIEVSFSGGVTSFVPGTKNLEEGILAADKALYLAKQGGKNQILIAEEKN
jgi:diguanylate cyclase (GGDEF)-like protein